MCIGPTLIIVQTILKYTSRWLISLKSKFKKEEAELEEEEDVSKAGVLFDAKLCTIPNYSRINYFKIYESLANIPPVLERITYIIHERPRSDSLD